MPMSFFIVTTLYSLIGIIWWLGARQRGVGHWAVGIIAIILWLGIFGKVRIRTPEPGFIGLAVALGMPVPYIFQAGVNWLWQRGQRYIGVEMIKIAAQIENRELLFDGIPAFKKRDPNGKPSLPAGSIKVSYAIRWRINYEDPEAVLRFFWNGLIEGTFAYLSNKGTIFSQALRQIAKTTEYEVLLQEDPQLFVPPIAHLLLGTPEGEMPNIPPEGMPDALGLGLWIESFGLVDVSLDRKDGAVVIADREAAQGIAAMAETLKQSGLSEQAIEKLIALKQGAKGNVNFGKFAIPYFNPVQGQNQNQNMDNDNDDDDDDSN
ncbi:MAG: hypothetical protein PHY72_03400 [Candidatus Pacebacteria bacterium]|nr:hypothetical protein [Candidatus Paceibacterota bacterium]